MVWKRRDRYLFDERWKKLSNEEKHEKAWKQHDLMGWLFLGIFIALVVGVVIGQYAANIVNEESNFSEVFKMNSYDLARTYCNEYGLGDIVEMGRKTTPYGEQFLTIECEYGSRRIDH